MAANHRAPEQRNTLYTSTGTQSFVTTHKQRGPGWEGWLSASMMRLPLSVMMRPSFRPAYLFFSLHEEWGEEVCPLNVARLQCPRWNSGFCLVYRCSPISYPIRSCCEFAIDLLMRWSISSRAIQRAPLQVFN